VILRRGGEEARKGGEGRGGREKEAKRVKKRGRRGQTIAPKSREI